MNSLRKYAAIVALLSLTLVIAACDNPFSDSDDDAEEVETPTTEVADDAVDTEAATDDVAADDAVEEATPEVAATESDDAAPVDDEAADDSAEATDDAEDAAADDSDATATGDQNADEILEQAAQRISELESGRFELDGTGYIEVDEIGEVSLSNAEGEFQRPDRARVHVDIDTALADLPLTVVSYDGEVYIEDPFVGSTHIAPDDFQFNPAIIFHEDDGIPALIRSVQNAELLDQEEIDGRQAYKIYGVIDGDLVERASAGMFPASTDVDFNVWIDVETYDVLKILAQDPTEESDSVWELRIYDHNEEVEIDDPS